MGRTSARSSKPFGEAQKRAEAGWPIVIALPTAPIGPHDQKPTPTGLIIVQFLNGKIPMLARTGLKLRGCAAVCAWPSPRDGAWRKGRAVFAWRNEPVVRRVLAKAGAVRRAPRPAPARAALVSYATACLSETAARFSPKWKPFVTRESVQMSRGPHFSSNENAERQLGYKTIPLDDAIRDAVNDFASRGLIPRRGSPGELTHSASRERDVAH